MHFEEHEPPIIGEAIRRNGGCCEGNAAEGLDGVGVQLETPQAQSLRTHDQDDGDICTYLCNLHNCSIASMRFNIDGVLTIKYEGV